jgi:hypothetical protein
LLIPAGLGVAIALEQITSRGRLAGPILASVLGALCLTEQLSATPSFDKIARREFISRIARELPEDAEVFYYSSGHAKHHYYWQDQLDAMFVHLEAGIPTVNGNLTISPPTWQKLENPKLRSNQGLRIQAALRDWRDLHPELREMKFYWLRVTVLGVDAVEVRDLTASSPR